MFTIGDFARHGRVSVRMLRHYDATGLLRPAHVDPATGYRYYTAAQLARLNRVIALKDLGFTLQQVQEILDEKVTTEELRAMLRLRRAELEAGEVACRYQADGPVSRLGALPMILVKAAGSSSYPRMPGRKVHAPELSRTNSPTFAAVASRTPPKSSSARTV